MLRAAVPGLIGNPGMAGNPGIVGRPGKPEPALPEKPLALFGWSADRVKTVRFMASEGKEP